MCIHIHTQNMVVGVIGPRGPHVTIITPKRGHGRVTSLDLSHPTICTDATILKVFHLRMRIRPVHVHHVKVIN